MDEVVDDLDSILNIPRLPRTAWAKGVSGNPLGRSTTPDDIDEVLRKVLGRGGSRQVAQSLVELALAGHFGAIQYIFDRLKGKPRQSTESNITVEHPLAKLLNEAMYDKRLPTGKRLPSLPEPSSKDEVREAASEDSGAEVP